MFHTFAFIKTAKHNYYTKEKSKKKENIILPTAAIAIVFRGPPGLGGDNFGLSNALDSQSFFTGGGTGVPTVAIDTSPNEMQTQTLSTCLISTFILK